MINLKFRIYQWQHDVKSIGQFGEIRDFLDCLLSFADYVYVTILSEKIA